jgi:hypothetical protein
MTLVLTELTLHGIAMAADSAVTTTNTVTGLSYVQPNAAKKLHQIPYLNAGVSCWGLGTISGMRTDQWLEDFIESNAGITTLQEFGEELAINLNSLIPSNNTQEGRLGFHLAGFEDYNSDSTPSFYHIHDDRSTTLEQRGIFIDPTLFNPNHDMPPHVFLQIASSGVGWITRNGDYLLYAQMFQLLENFFANLTPLGIMIPHSQNVVDRAEYLVFQIRTVSELYRLSNLVPGIGGRINYLTITQNGIMSEGIRYY